MQYGGWCAVRMMVCSTVEGDEYGGGEPSMQMRVYNTDQPQYQYEGGTSSVQRRACSKDQLLTGLHKV